jgi:hypothetical protein
MTRKRTRESLLHHLTEPCQHCEGKGYTKSRRTVAYGLLRELRRQGNLIEGDTVLVEVNPDIAQVLAGPDHVYLEEIEKRLQKRIVVKARGSFSIEDFELRSPGQKALEHSEAGREATRRSSAGPAAARRSDHRPRFRPCSTRKNALAWPKIAISKMARWLSKRALKVAKKQASPT